VSEDGKVVDGSVWIEKGRVIVKDPEEGGLLPSITPGENVEVFVDDKLVKCKVEVTTKNEIRVVPKEIPPRQDINVRVDKEKMHAYLTINVTPGRVYTVDDSPPARDLVISAKNFKEKMPAPPTVDEVRKALADKGIAFGIDEQSIIEAITSRDNQERLVASGLYPQRGQDARIEACFKEKVSKSDDEIWVDTFDYGTIISVDPGTVVARKVPPKPGKPGINVFGTKVEPPAPRDVELKAGKGVEIRNDGLEAVAVFGGRPQIKGSMVSVSPVYTVEGDVDKNTGNIYFKGDVVVKGSVLDGMKVKASGSVTVMGSATHCQIEAGGDVVIKKSIVSGIVKAGDKKIHLYPIRDLLISMSKTFKDLVSALGQMAVDPRLEDRPEVKKYGPGVILKILLDTKFCYIRDQYNELEKEVKAMGENGTELIFDSEFVELLSGIGRLLFGRGPLGIKSLEHIDRLNRKFQEGSARVLAEIDQVLKQKSSITVGYVQHSNLEATGDVVITGKGAYNVKIFSGGNVIVKDKKGFFRGGEITAEGDVEVYELGSAGGAATSVHVPAGKSIKSTVTHTGVKLKVGTTVKTVDMRIGNVE